MKKAMRNRKEWQRQTAAITAALMAMSVGGIAYAMPQGENIRSGKGEITRQDKDMTINQDSKRLAIDWAGFDIANDERVTFQQPGRDAVALNRVTGNAASVIDGTLAGNGHVYVVNPNGVLFGKGASVDVGSLVASTAKISDADMMNFGASDGAISMAVPEDSQAKVINAGTIRAEGRLVVLHAADARNTGTITNPGGTTALAAAKNLSISADTAGKINFTVDGKLAQAKALNSGTLSANGGYLVMTARSAGDVMSTVVNNTGTIEAKTLRQNEKGEILLDGGDNGVAELNGTIDASGMEAGQSAGSIKAIGAETHVGDDANLLAKGNVDGGLIETSGDYLEISDKANIDAAGETGSAGEWLLDPTNVVINDTGSSKVASGDNRYTSGTTYLKTSSIVKALQNNNVKIQAVDRNYGNADITLASELNVDQTTAGRNTFTLESQGDVNINANITATSPLNVVLNADSDGNDKGGVNINADIRTGGGSLTTGANGATFFGSTQEGEANRVVETAGGAVNIQNEARLQLNGGTLSINTSGGNVTFAKNVASMNKYEAFMDHDFVNYYQGSGAWTEQAQAWDNMLQSIYGKTYTDSKGNTTKFVITHVSYDWWGSPSYTDVAYNDLTNAEKVRLSNALAQTWEFANLAATQGNSVSDPDGKQLNGTHLVTITDKYENSAAMANAVKKNGAVLEYFTGGKETTNMSANQTSGRQFAWVTGPEKGTTFYISSGVGQGSNQNGMYTNWVQGGNGYSEPNNNNSLTKQPYVAIGWTDENGWDDVHNGASTIHGFIRETELPNSALAINSGAGSVTVGTEGTANTGKLGSGVGTGLRNVSIETTTGDVKVLDSIYVHDNNTNAAADLANGNVEITTQGNVDVGKITADKKVEISSTGAEKHVSVNGKIATDGLVSIESADDITVHGIQNADKIRLVSTDANGDGAITLADNTDGSGALITSSNANDAVVIDARGTNGSFHNNTTATSAITTGTNGNWKVYSASPDRDEFGNNLNSNTNAQWNATSTTYSAANDGNKYIFQVQPKMTVTADDKEKTYGVELSDSDLTVTKTAAFKGQDGTDIDVHNYENAFQEGDVMNHYTGTIHAESAGAAAAATRTGGVRMADDNNKAIYDITVSGNLEGKDGYGAPEYVNGNLEINRRTVNLNGSAAQTYGNATLNNKNVYAEAGSGDTGLYGNDKLDTDKVEYSISTTGQYAANKGDRVTADAGTYADELEFSNVHAVNGTANMDANYTFMGNGDITVDKKTIQKNELGIDGKPLYTTTYGTKNALGTATFHGVNGDGAYELDITDTSALTGETTGKVTKDVGDNYSTTVELSDALAKNYQFEGGATSKEFADTASVTKAKLTINTKGFEATYGDVAAVKKGLENAVTVSGLTNGDGPDTETVNGTSEALKVVNGEERTNDVKKGGYAITTDLNSLQDTINKNYEVEKTGGNAVITKKNIQLITDDIETTYGDGDTIYNALAAGNLLHLKDLASWDSQDKILKELQASTSVKGNVSAFKLDENGNIVTDSEGHRYTNDVRGYSISTAYFNAAKNYKVTSVKNGVIHVNKANLTINTDDKTTTYGTVDKDFHSTISGLVNGDDASIVNLAYNTKGYLNDTKTNDVGDYAINTTVNNLQNYEVSKNTANLHIDKADLTVKVGDVSTIYGTPFDESKYDYAVGQTANGDDAAKLKTELGSLTYTNEGAGENGKATKDVGTYRLLGTTEQKLHNYKVNFENGKAEVTPLTIDENNYKDYINSSYSTVYGQTAEFGKAAFTGVNGDKAELDITDSDALVKNGGDRKTQDAAKNAYNTVVSFTGLSDQMKKNYGLTDKTSATLDNTATVEKAKLAIDAKDFTAVYGDVAAVKNGLKDAGTITGLVNGDAAKYAAAVDGTSEALVDDTHTNNVGDYDVNAVISADTRNALNKNYEISENAGTATITPYTIDENNYKDHINSSYTTVYGQTAEFGKAAFTGVNGDKAELDITDSDALVKNGGDRKTQDAAKNAYNTVVSFTGLSDQMKKNYGLTDKTSATLDNTATVEKANLTVTRKGIETVYGTVKLDDGSMTTHTALVNGDADDITYGNGDYGTAYLDGNTRTNNVGRYDYKATLNSESDVLRNYNVTDEGTNYVNITPYTVTENDIVVSPSYTTKYGTIGEFGKAAFRGVNGDRNIEADITDSNALTGNTEGRVTNDVGTNVYNTTVTLDAENPNYRFADGTTSKVFEKTASVTPAELTIHTDDVETTYGTVKTTSSAADGLVNGDLPTGFLFDYGDYGGAYLNNNTKTNNVGTYAFGTKLSGADFLKNYTISGGDAEALIKPKDVHFHVEGSGNTLSDVAYTVTPDIDSQLVYGEHVDATYTNGSSVAENEYGVVANINGAPIISGDVAGNYRYTYDGSIVITPIPEPEPTNPDIPTKPDIDHNNPSNLNGSGSWTNNLGSRGIPGVDRVAGLVSAELPFFKVANGQVSNYGTYDVAADPDKERLEPTGKRLPEPNQPKTQYREYTKMLTTADGEGTFRMTYDGSTFNITPVDDAAMALVRLGDAKNNVELSAQALHAGFSEMGLVLEDLDGVYVHFDV